MGLYDTQPMPPDDDKDKDDANKQPNEDTLKDIDDALAERARQLQAGGVPHTPDDPDPAQNGKKY